MSRKFYVGQQVVFNTGSNNFKKNKSVFTIESILSPDYVTLSELKASRSSKISEENSENFKKVPLKVHTSNLSYYDPISNTPHKGKILRDGKSCTIVSKKDNTIILGSPQKKKQSS